MKNSYKFFANKECEYFPCHSEIEKEAFNCLFCYCPLYTRDCLGQAEYLENGLKSCSNCLLPHLPSSYELIMEELFNKR